MSYILQVGLSIKAPLEPFSKLGFKLLKAFYVLEKEDGFLLKMIALSCPEDGFRLKKISRFCQLCVSGSVIIEYHFFFWLISTAFITLGKVTSLLAYLMPICLLHGLLSGASSHIQLLLKWHFLAESKAHSLLSIISHFSLHRSFSSIGRSQLQQVAAENKAEGTFLHANQLTILRHECHTFVDSGLLVY